MKKTMTVMVMAIALALTTMAPVMAEADGSYDFPSTNELNRDKEVPGREGQHAPHVNLVDATAPITLEFVNDTNSLAFFEYRIDGEERTAGTPHPVVTGSFIYPGVELDGRGQADAVVVERSFAAASKTVEIRLALGGERDWDFDWTTFEVAPPPGRDDCRDGGFIDLGFRNQGQCIAGLQSNENATPHS